MTSLDDIGLAFVGWKPRQNWFRNHYSGYSSKGLEAKPVVVLQAYIDDSELGKPPVSVLAGWYATAETWVRFSEAWQKMLDGPPAIPYFKLREIRSTGGIGALLNKQQRLDREREAMSISADFDLIGFSNLVVVDQFKAEIASFKSKKYCTLYHALAYASMCQAADYLYSKGIRETVDFIFDQQMTQERDVLDTWYLIKRNAPSRLRRRLGATPVFPPDHEALPLQLADAFAWHTRRQVVRKLNGQELEPSPWNVRPENEMKRSFVAILGGEQLAHSVRYMTKLVVSERIRTGRLRPD